MLRLLVDGTERECRRKKKGAGIEMAKSPLPPSAIQQIKDVAGMPDMPNREFVAWFKRIFGLFENIRLAGAEADGIRQPVTPVLFTGDGNPPPAA